jgi:CRP/FNR family transcriptional regulator, nitrogen oxide reductase regulator
VDRAVDSDAESESGASLRPPHRFSSSHPGPSLAYRSDPVLHNARFLDGLSSSGRNAVLQSAQRRRYQRNSVVIEQGDSADRLFLLLKGCARHFFITPEGRKVNLFCLVRGDTFGGACLLSDPASFIVSTEITTESEVLVWERDTIRALARRYPRLLENGLSIACDYLVWYLATHLSLICHSARERLAHVLVSLARGVGQSLRDGIGLEITNEQLANTANVTPFTVSRLLSEWQRNGSILKSRGKLVLCRPEQLFRNNSAGRVYRPNNSRKQ